ncbi:alpha/beta fold hydrolase [Actinocorallia sp. A-T 12471]|uniref:alpha/beta fold hydrolase n=1 Tax=Actinocorallia sp. A-T 12471 TaxID=3089813 RepID=UPI0029D0C675|nr:alpha/beta fold hydrolase [Actinocorallia sp. A-T 12471]MDX6742407.1 alpha/beta fold hydrolase [Actinocorallia sp. A-T 12471]
MAETASRTVTVDGVRTHFLEAGDGPPVVLLHGGAWGECAATAWPTAIPALSRAHRVIAPDWLGFGGTDKIVDFADRAGRMLDNLEGLLAALGVEEADVVGLSMGGSHLLRDQTSPSPRLAVRRMVLVSAGGPPVSGDALAALMDFTGTVDAMRAQIALAFADPSWAADDSVVMPRLEAALAPGAYEAFASLALRPPGHRPPPLGDPFDYSRVTVPTLVTAGDLDRLKPPGFAADVAAAIPGAQLRTFPGCGHCPQLEAADAWNDAVLTFLAQPSPTQPSPAQPSPAETAQARTAPAQPSPAQPSPAETAQARTAPAETAQPAPAQAAPAETAQARTAPAETAQAAPAETARAEGAQIETAPAQSAQAKTSPEKENS